MKTEVLVDITNISLNNISPYLWMLAGNVCFMIGTVQFLLKALTNDPS